MSSPLFAPREIDVVERLASDVEAGKYGNEMQLLVRPHPQNVQGGMADESWLPRLRRLAQRPSVGVDFPRVRPSRLAWNMDHADLRHLSTLLSGSLACLNSGSTLSIDALLCGKPVILTCFDGDASLPWWQSAKRLTEYVHLSKLIEWKGVRVVRGYGELDEVIHRVIEDPDVDVEARRRTTIDFCGPSDGAACERVADALMTMGGAADARSSHSDGSSNA
jgi:hypothetical protein